MNTGFIESSFSVGNKVSLIFELLDNFSHDTELIRLLRNGDAKAYTAVYHRFIRPLSYFIISITADTQAAEDIASESFIKVFKRKEDFATLDDFKHFLFRVASNEALNYVKKQKRYRDHVGRWTQGQEHWTDDVHHKYIETEVVTAIYGELEKLPQQVREVVRLSLFENRKLEEIAEEMGLAHQTVKNHKTRGLAMLRDALSANKDLHPLVLIMALNILQANF